MKENLALNLIVILIFMIDHCLRYITDTMFKKKLNFVLQLYAVLFFLNSQQLKENMKLCPKMLKKKQRNMLR